MCEISEKNLFLRFSTSNDFFNNSGIDGESYVMMYTRCALFFSSSWITPELKLSFDYFDRTSTLSRGNNNIVYCIFNYTYITRKETKLSEPFYAINYKTKFESFFVNHIVFKFKSMRAVNVVYEKKILKVREPLTMEAIARGRWRRCSEKTADTRRPWQLLLHALALANSCKMMIFSGATYNNREPPL